MYKHNTFTALNINTFDGARLMATKFRGSMYKHNPACINPKRKQQVLNRMYRGFWVNG